MTANAHHLARLLDDAEDALRSLRRDAPGILKRAAIPSGRDGYPARASGSQASSPRIVRHDAVVTAVNGLFWAECVGCGYVGPRWPTLDAAHESARQHEDSQGQAVDYSDPTGEAATAGPERDPVKQTARNMLRDVDKAVRLLKAAANACAQEAGKGANLDDPTDWCSHHLAHTQTLEPRFRGDLCRNCYDHKRENGTLPPVEYLRRWANGQRVYKRDTKKGAA